MAEATPPAVETCTPRSGSSSRRPISAFARPGMIEHNLCTLAQQIPAFLLRREIRDQVPDAEDETVHVLERLPPSTGSLRPLPWRTLSMRVCPSPRPIRCFRQYPKRVYWCQRVGIASTMLSVVLSGLFRKKLPGRRSAHRSAFPGRMRRVFPSGEVARADHAEIRQRQRACACSSGASAWSCDALPIHASTRRAANSLYDWIRRSSVVLRARRYPFRPANLSRGHRGLRRMPGGRTVFLFLLAERFHAAPTEPPRTGQKSHRDSDGSSLGAGRVRRLFWCSG